MLIELHINRGGDYSIYDNIPLGLRVEILSFTALREAGKVQKFNVQQFIPVKQNQTGLK